MTFLTYFAIGSFAAAFAMGLAMLAGDRGYNFDLRARQRRRRTSRGGRRTSDTLANANG